ncbi:hypothetical protein L1887_23333 [Cichorium endivia]|nr:hypothetical protein L1887_23333 [Cichorium endivia]
MCPRRSIVKKRRFLTRHGKLVISVASSKNNVEVDVGHKKRCSSGRDEILPMVIYKKVESVVDEIESMDSGRDIQFNIHECQEAEAIEWTGGAYRAAQCSDGYGYKS